MLGFLVGHAWFVAASSIIARAAIAVGATRLVVDLDPEAASRE
jgi:hypothetical protein